MSQSSNDSFPSAMNIAAGVAVTTRMVPAVAALRDAFQAHADEWKDIVKIGRTHMQDATPLTLGQEWSGYAGVLTDDLARLDAALHDVWRLALGGTAVGTGINSAPGFAEAGRRAAGELRLPELQAGSSIMPGKVNPTQCEALTMIAVQVMANDVAVGLGGAGGYLEMNVYKPLMIYNVTHSIAILTGGCTNFRRFLVEGTRPNRKQIDEYVQRSLMLVTALSPVIGYDKASRIAHHAMDHDLTLKEAALQLRYVTEDEFDRIVDPAKMVEPYVATEPRPAQTPNPPSRSHR